MFVWTSSEIERILIQLDEQRLPFDGYSFYRREDGMNMLGQGAFSRVYGATVRGSSKENCVIKVMGFNDRCLGTDEFYDTSFIEEELMKKQPNVVAIYEYVELFVWLDDDNNITNVRFVPGDEDDTECLKLQFVAMERLEQVVHKDASGKIQLFPERLRQCNDDEIIKLAYDIAKALSVAHNGKYLHRDIKLEIRLPQSHWL